MEDCIILVDLWNIKDPNPNINNYYNNIYNNINKFLEHNKINKRFIIYNANSNNTAKQPSFLNNFEIISVGDYISDTDQYSKISTDYILDNYNKIYIMGLSLDECCMGDPLGYKRLKQKAFIVKDCVIQQANACDKALHFANVTLLLKYIDEFLENGHIRNHPREGQLVGGPVIYEKINHIKSFHELF
jgi:hypothetical protein|tara:strand:- start:5579 stop:6142 length:564 start_codon:yes stop_codon:yes gene_type:complete